MKRLENRLIMLRTFYHHEELLMGIGDVECSSEQREVIPSPLPPFGVPSSDPEQLRMLFHPLWLRTLIHRPLTCIRASQLASRKFRITSCSHTHTPPTTCSSMMKNKFKILFLLERGGRRQSGQATGINVFNF